MKLIIVLSLLLSFTSVYARNCDDKYPVFSVNGQAVWEDISAREILEKADKKDIPKAKKINAQGIWLADLVRPHATTGTLVLKSCGKRSATLNIDNLLSKDKQKSSYYLAKTKRHAFKLVFADGEMRPKPELKRIQTIDLITQTSAQPEKKRQ